MRTAHREVYANPWLHVEVHQMVHPNGTAGEHVLVRTGHGASGVIVVDGDSAYFVKQPRFAARTEIMEIVKGGREAGESALDAAKRELREELGCTAEKWTHLGQTWEIPSVVEGMVDLFLAQNLSWHAPDPEQTESVRTVRLPMDEALEGALNGAITDATTVTAIVRAGRVLDLIALP